MIATSLAAVASRQLLSDACLSTFPTIDTTGCDEDDFISKLKESTLDESCGTDNEAIVTALLQTIEGSDDEDFQTKVCNPAKENISDEMKTSFYTINDEESSPAWYKRFYDGDTYLNEHVDDDAGLRVKVEGSYIQTFRDTAGSTLVSFPNELANFNNCAIEAAMCCWVQDRQANDNNGGCADNTYAANCKNQNPGDNTDVCKFHQSRMDTTSVAAPSVSCHTVHSQTLVTMTKKCP